mgnify:FL=1
MKTVKVQPNQNVFDLAVQHYGNVEAVDEILLLNPEIGNDPLALKNLGVDTAKDRTFRLDAAVKPGSTLRIDETSKLTETRNLKKITNEVTTYQTEKSWQGK